MNYFFTADTHFGHKNIVNLSKRPFSSLEDMDETLIRNWNSKVKKNDIIFHLGDFVFMGDFDRYFNRLNGNIFLIKGNHDSIAWRNKEKFIMGYSDGYCELHVNGLIIIMCHYAMLTWNKSHYGSYHLYGHSHGTLPDNLNSLSMDCGVDTNNYFPYSLDEITERISKKSFVPVDHHGKS